MPRYNRERYPLFNNLLIDQFFYGETVTGISGPIAAWCPDTETSLSVEEGVVKYRPMSVYEALYTSLTDLRELDFEEWADYGDEINVEFSDIPSRRAGLLKFLSLGSAVPYECIREQTETLAHGSLLSSFNTERTEVLNYEIERDEALFAKLNCPNIDVAALSTIARDSIWRDTVFMARYTQLLLDNSIEPVRKALFPTFSLPDGFETRFFEIGHGRIVGHDELFEWQEEHLSKQYVSYEGTRPMANVFFNKADHEVEETGFDPCLYPWEADEIEFPADFGEAFWTRERFKIDALVGYEMISPSSGIVSAYSESVLRDQDGKPVFDWKICTDESNTQERWWLVGPSGRAYVSHTISVEAHVAHDDYVLDPATSSRFVLADSAEFIFGRIPGIPPDKIEPFGLEPEDWRSIGSVSGYRSMALKAVSMAQDAVRTLPDGASNLLEEQIFCEVFRDMLHDKALGHSVNELPVPGLESNPDERAASAEELVALYAKPADAAKSIKQ